MRRGRDEKGPWVKGEPRRSGYDCFTNPSLVLAYDVGSHTGIYSEKSKTMIPYYSR